MGTFETDMLHGQGSYSWSDGRVYVGMWNSGCMDGKGVYKWPGWLEGTLASHTRTRKHTHQIYTQVFMSGQVDSRWEDSGRERGLGRVQERGDGGEVGMADRWH